MKRTVFATAILLGTSLVTAQTDSAQWKEEPVTPDAAEAFLDATLHGEKRVTITGMIASTNEKVVDRGTHCTSSSDGGVNGRVDDSGNVSGTTNTEGTTDCRNLRNYFYWMDVVYASVDSPDSGYIITARCDVRWVWNHCTLPIVGSSDTMVISREKKGKYFISISLRTGAFDRKGTVSKYEIVDLKHFKRQAQ